MNNQYEIVNWDFSRNDGLVTVRIKNRARNQIAPVQLKPVAQPPVERLLEIQQNQLVTEKIRTKKIIIQALKDLLKRRQDVNQIKEFYRLYGHKLVEMDFGLIELYNIKGENMFSIQELEHIERNAKFIRWGKIFSLAALQSQSQFSEILSSLQFYNSLVRERIFSLRTLKYYKDDNLRKQFPYSQLYVMDIEDTFDFAVQHLQGNAQQSANIESASIQMISIDKWDSQNMQSPRMLWQLRRTFFEQYYNQRLLLNNVIIPLIQFHDSNDDLNSQFFFIHLILVNQRYECQIFVDVDCLICSPEQLILIIFTLLKMFDFDIIQQDISINNQKINDHKAFMNYYVQYIESTFFKNTGPQEQIMQQIFEDIPIQLLRQPYNYTLDERFIIPSNFAEIANLLQK